MHALMISEGHNLPVIVNMESRYFAELSVAGYIPIQTGYKRELERVEEEMLLDIYGDLEMNDNN